MILFNEEFINQKLAEHQEAYGPIPEDPQPRPKRIPEPETERPLLYLTAERAILAGLSLSEGVTMARKELVAVALEQSGGNIVRAAQLLRVHRNTLSRIIVENEMGHLPRQCRREAQARRKEPK